MYCENTKVYRCNLVFPINAVWILRLDFVSKADLKVSKLYTEYNGNSTTAYAQDAIKRVNCYL